MESAGMMKAIGEGYPSGRVPERALERFLVATEACSGKTPDQGFLLGVSVFIGIFGVDLTLGGSPSRPRDRAHAQGVGRAPHPRGQPGTLLAQLFYSGGFFWSIKNHKKLARQLDSVWYSFFVKLKKGKNRNLHWALG